MKVRMTSSGSFSSVYLSMNICSLDRSSSMSSALVRFEATFTIKELRCLFVFICHCEVGKIFFVSKGPEPVHKRPSVSACYDDNEDIENSLL